MAVYSISPLIGLEIGPVIGAVVVVVGTFLLRSVRFPHHPRNSPSRKPAPPFYSNKK